MAEKIDIDLEEVARLAGLGLSQVEIAISLGISERTLRNRKKDSADFAAAIEKGKAKAGKVVANKLFKLCEQGNLGAIVWYEKTRRGLTDKQAVELTGSNGGPIRVAKAEDLTDDELANIASGSRRGVIAATVSTPQPD